MANKSFKNKIKSIPWFVWVSCVGVLAWLGLTYLVGFLVGKYAGGNRIWTPYIPAIDDHIPMFPYVFWLIYILAFVYWFITPILAWKTGKQNYINFLFIVFISLFICMLIYVICPPIMDRSKDGIWQKIQDGWGLPYILMRWIYGIRGTGIVSYCKLPSTHTLLSVICCLAIFKKKQLPKWVWWLALSFTVLIMLSTLFTKAHYFLDLIVGLATALVSWGLITIINPGKHILKAKPEWNI